MPFQSRWQVSVPDAHLATLLFQSSDHPLSKTKRSFIDVDHPDTHFLTAHEFRLWSQRFAAGLRGFGVKPGDRILLFSGNSIFFPAVYMGIIMAGGIFTSANPALVPRELVYQLRDSGATLMVCAEANLKTALAAADQSGLSRDRVFALNLRIFEKEKGIKSGPSQAAVDLGALGCRDWSELLASEGDGSQFRWDELNTPELSARTLALNYSSGTTGVPKGVEVSHKNVIANILQFNHLARLDPEYAQRVVHTRWLCPLPMYHAMGQNMFVGIAFTRGIPVYLLTKFNYDKFLRAIAHFRITDLTLVPPIVVRMAKDRDIKNYDLSSIQSIFCGAAPLGKEGAAEVEALWPRGQVNVKQGWGMTETTSIVTAWNPLDWSSEASVGELVPNCEARVVSEDGLDLGRNQRGELWVRGPNVMRGYWGNEKATRETLLPDGWLKTGDIAYIDDNGKWFIVDRKKELIKVKGNQVAPAELEDLLLEHPAISSAAVIGVPHQDDERPRAYVELKPGKSAGAEEIADFINNKVSRTKRITGGVIFVDSIPKSPSGKILRNVLREMAKAETRPARL
ncbi:hypothetical protein BJY01DRAFT_230772 [Aspergillus pseudoustus]|uniref:4-coumarate-CoA ligase n=1 Tax=Aspergillus pseudoustus TaxID=1810923 RepID=A0ABR4L261_9EURO